MLGHGRGWVRRRWAEVRKEFIIVTANRVTEGLSRRGEAASVDHHTIDRFDTKRRTFRIGALVFR